MKTALITAITSTVLSAAVCLALWTALGGGRKPLAGEAAEARLLAMEQAVRSFGGEQRAVLEDLSRLKASCEELRAGVAALREQLASSRGVEAGSKSAEGGGDASPAAAGAGDPAADGGAQEAALEEALERLVDPAAGEAERQRAWSAIAERGLIDRAVAFFEARARDNPRDPQAQTSLGHAYLRKLLVAGEAEKGKWAMKADGAYDRALELDGRQWEARFSKALSYSYWPAVTGMQAKAIEHLEILRTQQEEAHPERSFARTYSVLGNLYANQGKLEKAREVWAQGLALFPENEDLRKKAAPAVDR